MAETMPTATLDAIAELGREFRRLGWKHRLPALADYYRAVAAGRSSTERWSSSHLEHMRRVMYPFDDHRQLSA